MLGTGVSRPTSVRGVRTTEQIPHRLAPEQREPAAALVLAPVVQHVTALAESRQVLVSVVAGIVVPVRRRQHHPGGTHETEEVLSLQPSAQTASFSVPPETAVGVPP